MAPLIPATAVASITALRSALGYSDPRERRCQSFYDDVRAFRKKFVASSGIHGKDLHQWKLKEHQAGLSEMVYAYLEKQENGVLYWPDDKDSLYYCDVVYSQDSIEIQNLLKHLFFRLNLQQYRNEKYRQKAKPDETGPQERGTSTDDPIDVDAEQNDRSVDGPTQVNGQTCVVELKRNNDQSFSRPLFSTGRFRARSRTTDSDAENQASGHRQREAPSEICRMSRDLYSVTRSPSTTHPEHLVPTEVARPFEQPKPSEEEVSSEPPKKRLKIKVLPSTGEMEPSMPPPTKRKSLIFTFPKRKLLRGRVSRLDPILSTQDTIEDLIVSSSRATSIASPDPGEEQPTYYPAANDTHSEEMNLEEEGYQPPAPTVEKPVDDNTGTTPSIENVRIVSPHTTHDQTRTKQGSDAEVKDIPDNKPPVIQQSVPPRSRPKIKFGYSIVVSREPRIDVIDWIPEGRFSDKTFAEIKKEIPLDLDADPSAKGLHFTLLGPGLRYGIGVSHGDDDKLAEAKRRFKERLRYHIPNGDGSEHVYFDIEIEAWRDVSQLRTDLTRWDGDLEDLDW